MHPTMSPSTTRWRVLKLPLRQGKPRRPTLLVQHLFQPEAGPDSYEIFVTDLVNVWSEKLDRKRIITRALNDGTSIDPSEGADQLRLLLRHIQSALDGEAGYLRLEKGDRDDQLVLHVSVDLPQGLAPLEWPIQLTRLPDEALFSRLTSDVFERSFRLQAEVDSLLSHISEKDNLIARLVDKMESSGIELSSVFPGASSGRGSKSAVRSTLMRNVPGLKPFDSDQWAQEMDKKEWASKEELLFRAVNHNRSSRPHSTDRLKHYTDWRADLAAEGEELGFPSKSEIRSLSPSSIRVGTSLVTEDDFQEQDVSKLARNQHKTDKIQVKDSQAAQIPKTPHEEDSTTEDDDDDLDAVLSPPRPSNPASQKPMPPASPPARRLGVLGGKSKQPVKSPSPTPDTMAIDASAGVIEPDSMPQAPRKKIGRIGGLLNSKPDSQELPLRNPLEITHDVHEANGTDRSSRQSTRASKTPPRESSTERADRKRAELKHNLEEKRKAPVKKKRKF